MSTYATKNRLPRYGNEIPYKKGIRDILRNMEVKVIDLDIFSLREITSNDFRDQTVDGTSGAEHASGGILASLGAIGSINRINGATDKGARVVFKANTTGEFQFRPIVVPDDMDKAENAYIKLNVAMAGSTNTPVISVGCFFGVGDTNCGGNTAALSVTRAWRSVTIIPADLPTPPEMMNITLIPGAHATDAIWLYGAAFYYTRKAA